MYVLGVINASDGAVTIIAVGIVQAIVGTEKIVIVESSTTGLRILQQSQDGDAVAYLLAWESVASRRVLHQIEDVYGVADPLAETSVVIYQARSYLRELNIGKWRLVLFVLISHAPIAASLVDTSYYAIYALLLICCVASTSNVRFAVKIYSWQSKYTIRELGLVEFMNLRATTNSELFLTTDGASEHSR